MSLASMEEANLCNTLLSKLEFLCLPAAPCLLKSAQQICYLSPGPASTTRHNLFTLHLEGQGFCDCQETESNVAAGGQVTVSFIVRNNLY